MPEGQTGAGAAGWILAGGASRRMGRDKALLEWGGRPLALHIARLLETVVSTVAIVGPPERYAHLGLRVVPDLRPGEGPLAGIEAALAATPAEWNLIVACDQPMLDAAFVTALQRTSLASQADCVIPGSPLEPQPLCAGYHRRCLPCVREALNRGERRVRDLLRRLQVDWLPLGDTSRLAGANTPEEWLSLVQSEKASL
ncbi:MAG: molybdenum cofactor guanylyltransferase [Bryobacteraceae bacterium]|nr:molybdenum cofactor guanylyltransferase [Bryobacteraceae bacterium]